MTEIGIIFDMDGVIVDNHLFHYRSWEEICAKYGKPLSEESYKNNLNGRTLNEVVQFIFNEPMPIERVREIGNEKESLYRKLYKPELKLTKGLEVLLSSCKAHNIPLAVGTSAPVENVEFTLDGLGIRHLFKAILDERAVTKGKPNPQIYIKCAEALELSNANCVVFEDAISGIKAGKSAGSKVIGVATSHSRSELVADRVIDDFVDITVQEITQLIHG